MFFFKLANPEMFFLKSILLWLSYFTQLVLPTKQYIILVELQIFVKNALNENKLCFIIQVFFVLSYIDLNRVAHPHIAAIMIEKIIEFPPKYTEYAKVFLHEKAVKLPKRSFNNNKIIWEKGKIPIYGPIYSLEVLELKVLWTYIEIKLNNRFIQPSTSPASAPIFFTKKTNTGL